MPVRRFYDQKSPINRATNVVCTDVLGFEILLQTFCFGIWDLGFGIWELLYRRFEVIPFPKKRVGKDTANYPPGSKNFS
jgi:hypothetical protein